MSPNNNPKSGPWCLIFWLSREDHYGRKPETGFYKLAHIQTNATCVGYKICGVIVPLIRVGVRFEKTYYSSDEGVSSAY